MIVSLPFAYQAEFLPRGRGGSRRRLVRDDVDIDVVEFSRKELIPGLELREPCSVTPIETFLLLPDGRLTSPVRSTVDGAAMTVLEFRNALAESSAGAASCLDREILPFADRARSMSLTDLSDRPTVASELARCSLQTRTGTTTDRDARRDEAKSRYSKALVVVDGMVYSECAEPVWQVTHRYGQPFGLRFQRRPDAFWCADLFRMDRLEDAIRWADRWKVSFERPRLTVHVVDMEGMKRDDVDELAAFAKSPLARGWFDAFEPYVEDERRRPLVERVEAFLRLDRRLNPTERRTYLDALVDAYRGIMQLTRDARRGDTLGFAWIAERWVLERELRDARGSEASRAMVA